MKRMLVLLMIFLSFSAVVWAGGKQEKAKKIRIIHYHWTETTYDKINLNAVKIFEKKHPNVEVKLLLLPDADRAKKIRTALAANGEIDSFALNNGESAEFLSEGQMVEIMPKAFGKKTVDEVVKMWTPGAIKTSGGYWKGKYYGIPFELSNYVAWINIAYMKDAGLSPATDKPKTWGDFVNVGRKLVKEKGGVRVRNGFAGNSKEGIFNFLILTAMMEQLGLDWGTEEGLLSSMDKPDVLARGLRTYTDFVVKDKIWDPGLFDNDREGFGNGKTAMFLTGGSWYWGVLDTYSVSRKEAEPFAYPRFPGGKDLGGVGYGYCVYVSRLAKNPELTWEWLDTLASQPNEFIKYGYNQPRVKLSDGSQGLNPELAKKYIPYYDETFKGELAKTSVWLSSTKGAQVTDAVWAAISKVIYEGAKVSDSVAELRSAIPAIYK